MLHEADAPAFDIIEDDPLGRFLRSAARRPGAPAIETESGTTTYGSLAARVRGLAGAIVATGPQAKVLIALPAGANAYAAMLATAMAGGVYAPVNRASPAAKQSLIARHFAPDLVIAARADWPEFAAVAPAAALLDPVELAPDGTVPGSTPLATPVPPGARHALAYVIFTSGSTGTPKGVEIPRGALAHYVAWLGGALDIRPGDRVSQYANIAFDLSVMEIYGALCHGASLHPADGMADRLFPARLIAREGLTHWISVPSVVSLMNQAGELTAENLASIRRFVFCGEPLTPSHVGGLLHAVPAALVQNTYGPTEATVSMTSVVLASADVPRLTQPSVALGAPIPGMDVLLVGGPHEDEGELVLLGPQLARGYLDNPAATARAFRTVPTPDGERRAYFTGDWARRIDGQLYFQVRTDFQIKHNGHRIELGEIQAALTASGVTESVVFLKGGKLVAMVEAAATMPAQLRRDLQLRIEPYAVPDIILPVEQLPRNDNDKIDRAASIALFEEARL